MVVIKERRGTMIRKKTEQITIQHNTNTMMMLMMMMMMMMMMMTIINTYAGVDAVVVDTE